MRDTAVKFVSIYLCILSLLLTSSYVSADELVLDSILASIDGEPVTLTELRRHVATQMYSSKENVPSPEELTVSSPNLRTLLQDLVLSRLLDKEADAVGISVSKEEIDAYISEIQRQNRVDEDGFVAILQQQGLSWDEYVLQIKNDILKNRVVSARVRSKINVVDEDVERYMAERPELTPEVGSIRLQQIRIPLSTPEQRKSVENQITGLQMQLATLSGSELRRAFARAGGAAFQDLGHVQLDDLRSEIRDVVSPMESGQVSTPVEIGPAIYLFFVAGRVTEESPIDEAMEAEIKEQIFQVKFQEELKTFLDVELPKRYHVEFKI